MLELAAMLPSAMLVRDGSPFRTSSKISHPQPSTKQLTRMKKPGRKEEPQVRRILRSRWRDENKTRPRRRSEERSGTKKMEKTRLLAAGWWISRRLGRGVFTTP